MLLPLASNDLICGPSPSQSIAMTRSRRLRRSFADKHSGKHETHCRKHRNHADLMPFPPTAEKFFVTSGKCGRVPRCELLVYWDVDEYRDERSDQREPACSQ